MLGKKKKELILICNVSVAGGDQINLCLDTRQSDASFVKYKRYREMTSATCKLDHYIIQCLTLEFVVKELMDRVIGEGGIYDIFVECLLYYLPEKYSMFYAPDVDIDRHEGVMNLMFENGTSLIDNASTSHMKRHTKGTGPLEADACVDVYDFQPQDFMAIKDGDPRIASALTLADDGFGECAKMWCNGQRYGLLQIIEGVMRGAIIASIFGSKTSIHVEDGF